MTTYRIVIEGELSDRFAPTFGEMHLERGAGETSLIGEVVDQAQLQGLLARIADLGLSLRSVASAEAGSENTAVAGHMPLRDVHGGARLAREADAMVRTVSPDRWRPASTRRISREGSMTLGPLEYIVIGFDGNRFNGEIAREIEKVVEKKIIRLVDVVFVMKDIDGEVTIVELDDKDDPRFAGFAPLMEDLMGLLTPDDIAVIGQRLPNSSSALIMLFEHRWAEHLKDAITAAGGFLVARETVAPEALEMLNAEIEAVAV